MIQHAKCGVTFTSHGNGAVIKYNKMDAQTALKKVHLIEVNNEIEAIQDAIFGFEKADILVFYTDSFGVSRAMNLSSLKSYPLNVGEEINAMLKMTLANCKSVKSELR